MGAPRPLPDSSTVPAARKAAAPKASHDRARTSRSSSAGAGGSKSRGSSRDQQRGARPGGVPLIDGKGVAARERQRNARRNLEEAIAGSKAFLERKPQQAAPVGGKTHRAVVTEAVGKSKACTDWALAIKEAVQEGIDTGLTENILEAGVYRILELEETAAKEEAEVRRRCEAQRCR